MIERKLGTPSVEAAIQIAIDFADGRSWRLTQVDLEQPRRKTVAFLDEKL